jgi:hypothetical protein
MPSSRRDEHVGADASQFTRRKPRTTLATYCWPRRALDLAKLMNYDIIIITDADLSDDPAFIYPFKANKVDDFEVAVREAIAEWRRYNPNHDFLKAGCTVLVEKAVFSCSPQAVADAVS